MKFSIIWHECFSAYKVSIPDYPGGEVCTIDELQAAEARAAALERQVEAQQIEIKAASDVIELAYVVLGNGDFKNGVTDNSGTIDEGEVYAGKCFEEMRQWLLCHETTQNYVRSGHD